MIRIFYFNIYFFFFFFFIFLASGQKNTILIIADDISPDYFGFYTNSTDTVNAPNIRSLLNNGVQFTKVWAAPLCSTTRAALFTGRYPFRTGVGSVIVNPSSAQLDTAEMSIAKLLKYYAPVKYQTANIGKWHLHVQTPPKYLYPNKMGYDHYSGNFNGQLTNYYKYTRITDGILDSVKIYATTQTVDDAIDWLGKTNKSKPIFLWLAFNAPHFPYHLPPSNLCNTAGLSGTTQDINSNPKKYFKAAAEAMDTEIGRLFKFLKENDLFDDTNIIFIGDNGNDSRVAKIADKNKAKATLYDYGVHVPMIISGPDVSGQKRVSDAIVSTTDLFATIAELSGFTDWENFIPAGKTVDSKSILPIIKNQSATIRDWVFSEQFTKPAIDDDGKSIRNQHFHLIKFDNGSEALYNQTDDPEENINLLSRPLTETERDNYTFLCNSLNNLLSKPNCEEISLDEEVKENNIKIYPNPVFDYFQIFSDVDVNKVIITDIVGKLVFVGSTSSVSTDQLSQGMYTVHIYFKNNKLIRKKIIISK